MTHPVIYGPIVTTQEQQLAAWPPPVVREREPLASLMRVPRTDPVLDWLAEGYARSAAVLFGTTPPPGASPPA